MANTPGPTTPSTTVIPQTTPKPSLRPTVALPATTDVSSTAVPESMVQTMGQTEDTLTLLEDLILTDETVVPSDAGALEAPENSTVTPVNSTAATTSPTGAPTIDIEEVSGIGLPATFSSNDESNGTTTSSSIAPADIPDTLVTATDSELEKANASEANVEEVDDASQTQVEQGFQSSGWTPTISFTIYLLAVASYVQ